MYKMIYKTIKITKQTSNTKTYVQDDIVGIECPLIFDIPNIWSSFEASKP